REAVRLEQHLVVDQAVLERPDLTPNQVAEAGAPALWDAHPHDRPLGEVRLASPFDLALTEAEAVVLVRLLARLGGLALPLEPLGRAPAAVRVARRHEPLDLLVIQRLALRLTVRPARSADIRPFVPLQPGPAQRI